MAVFGAKLSSTAASVGVHTSKYKQSQLKDPFKESHRESMFADSPEPHVTDSSKNLPSSPASSTSNTLKSKMFKQSKTDLKNLRIKTDLSMPSRPSLGDRSPMVRGESTRELDRIAAIGQANSPIQSSDSHSGLSLRHHHLHHPHISFRKRDSPAAVLSSSASNSTLASEGTVYSFSQANTNGQSAVTSLHSFKTKEEATSFLDSSWSLLTLRIQSVFSRDEALRIPVEDVNILVVMHFSAHHALNGTSLGILRKVDDLLRTGLRASSIAPQHQTPESLAESWTNFHSKTLIYSEAIFLPLQLEFEGQGQVFTTKRAAKQYWYPGSSTSSRLTHSKAPKLSIRQRVLEAYRDVVVVPVAPKILQVLEENEIDEKCASKILQCFTALCRQQAEPEVEELFRKIVSRLRDLRGGSVNSETEHGLASENSSNNQPRAVTERNIDLAQHERARASGEHRRVSAEMSSA